MQPSEPSSSPPPSSPPPSSPPPAVSSDRPSGADRATHAADLAAVTRHRAELREAASALEAALAAPAPGRIGPWLERVRAALMELLADFREHVELTEGVKGVERSASRGGQYAALLRVAPRLTAAVNRLCQEHVELLNTITENLDRLERLPQPLPSADPPLDVSPDTIRSDCTRLLGQLVRHRQRGSDLFYEAYEVDIGGQD